MRIVSLLPSATEIVCGLGLQDLLVGVTHECDYPAWVTALPKVTRTLIPTEAPSREIDRSVRGQLERRRALYALDTESLEALRPDLIVTQALCDVCAVAEDEVFEATCSLPLRPEVLNLEPTSLAEILRNIQWVAEAADISALGRAYVDALAQRVQAVTRRVDPQNRPPRVVLLEWIDPLFACGHWSPELVRLAGGVEGVGHEGERSRPIDWREVLDWRPEVMVIACCGFTVERAIEDVHILRSFDGWEDLPCARTGDVFVVDGSAYFSRPGPRVVDSLELIAHALDPERHPLPPHLLPPLRLDESWSRGRAAPRLRPPARR